MFYEKIAKLCKERNISIARLEREAGIGNGCIGKWTTRIPNFASLEKVAKALDIPIAELVDD